MGIDQTRSCSCWRLIIIDCPCSAPATWEFSVKHKFPDRCDPLIDHAIQIDKPALDRAQLRSKIDEWSHNRECHNRDRDEPVRPIFRVFRWWKLIVTPVALHDQFLPLPIVAIA